MGKGEGGLHRRRSPAGGVFCCPAGRCFPATNNFPCYILQAGTKCRVRFTPYTLSASSHFVGIKNSFSEESSSDEESVDKVGASVEMNDGGVSYEDSMEEVEDGSGAVVDKIPKYANKLLGPPKPPDGRTRGASIRRQAAKHSTKLNSGLSI